MDTMNPVSSSLLVFVALLFIVALIVGVAIGVVLARSRAQSQIDAALAQAGNAAQVGLAEARERLRASEQAATSMQAEIERTRAENLASRNEVLRVSASEAQKSQLVTSLEERVAALQQEAAAAATRADLRAQELQTAHAELAQVRTRADADRSSAQEKL